MKKPSMTYQQFMNINPSSINNAEQRVRIQNEQKIFASSIYFFSPKFMEILGLNAGMPMNDVYLIFNFFRNFRTEDKFCPYCLIQRGVREKAVNNGYLPATNSDHSLIPRFYCKTCKRSFVIPSNDFHYFYIPGLRRKKGTPLWKTETLFGNFVENYLHYEYVLCIKKAYRTKRTPEIKHLYSIYTCQNDTYNLMESVARSGGVSPKTAGIWRKRIIESLKALVNKYSDSFESRREAFFMESEAGIRTDAHNDYIASVCLAVIWYYYRQH